MATSLDNKKQIIEAMTGLMAEKSLEEIRTVDICTRAGISRQTFYRCFDDKYDAAVWFVENAAKHSMCQIGITLSWRTGHRLMFQFVAHNALFMKRLFETHGHSSVSKTLVENVLESNMVKHYRAQYAAATGSQPDELIDYQIRAFAKLSISCLEERHSLGVGGLGDDFLERFLSLVPRQLFDALERQDAEASASPVFFL